MKIEYTPIGILYSLFTEHEYMPIHPGARQGL
jgi:hypothetical protein